MLLLLSDSFPNTLTAPPPYPPLGIPNTCMELPTTIQITLCRRSCPSHPIYSAPISLPHSYSTVGASSNAPLPLQPVAKPNTRLLAVSCCVCFPMQLHVWLPRPREAILMVTIPMAMAAADSQQSARQYFVLSTAGHIALMPLLFTEQEYLVKVNLAVSIHPVDL